MATKTSLHTEKCCHLVSEHEVSARCLWSRVCKFLIHSASVLVYSVNVSADGKPTVSKHFQWNASQWNKPAMIKPALTAAALFRCSTISSSQAVSRVSLSSSQTTQPPCLHSDKSIDTITAPPYVCNNTIRILHVVPTCLHINPLEPEYYYFMIYRPDEAPACTEGTVATKEQFCFVLVDCIYLPYLAS